MFHRQDAVRGRVRGESDRGAGGSRSKALLLAATACASGLIFAVPAQAQDNQVGEVIVTARKRQESILNVPVAETAVSQVQLERVQVKDVRDLARFVPGLSFGQGPANIGTIVTIRGVGTTAIDPGVDQSISLYSDGMQFSQGLAYSAAMFDVGQAEVLKGPQSLFYGKSSPGGVITVRTADPTNAFEVVARGGYEFEAAERRGEFIISGPLTDEVKMRLSTMYTKSDGFFNNKAVALPGTGGLTPRHKHDARKGYVVRLTTLWDPTDRFSARLKVNFVHDDYFAGAVSQLASCPEGTAGTAPLNIPFLGGGEDCKIDRTARIVDMDPAAFGGTLWYNGEPRIKNDQRYGTLELNYKLTPELTVTSLTGYSKLKGRTLFQAGSSSFAGSALGIQNKLDRREFQQEIRLNSDYAGPLNYTFGAFLQDARIFSASNIVGNTRLGLPALLTNGLNYVDVKTYSGFGQLRYKITPQLELAGGVRYTDEERTDHAFNAGSPATPFGVKAPVLLCTGTGGVRACLPSELTTAPSIRSKNWSPEVTLTYRPTDYLTAYGSWKRGYKSGSFSLGTALANGKDISYGDERVQGGEVGLKSRLFERTLALDLAAYDYRYKGLQVGSSAPNTSGVPESRILNAGSAKVYGFEWDATYRPPQIEGLALRFAGAWTHARFGTLNNIPCFGGQLFSEGCTQLVNPNTGLPTAQNLAGTRLSRAPNWQLTGGFDYERPLANGLSLALNSSAQYFGKYVTFPANTDVRPDFFSPSYTKVNASVTLKGREDRWEVALIGNNIFNKLTAGACSSFNGQNSSAFGPALSGQIQGSTTRGPAGVDEVVCRVDRGREVWVRFTLRPYN